MTAGLEAGDRLGRFAVVRRLGAGGMGTVYQARDPELGRDVAIKLLRDDRGDPTRLVREAQALAALSHPNVVAVHELGTHDGQVFVAMELVDGDSLDHHLADLPTTGRRRWREVLGLFVQAGRGLAAVHARELVHRDLKPSNLLIDRAGRVRVSDFGLARLERAGTTSEVGATAAASMTSATSPPSLALAATVDDSDGTAGAGAATPAPRSGPTPDGLLASPLTAAGAVVGTPRYMAPEQHRGGTVTRAADQFAFCVALWEALYGEHPFPDEDLATLRAAVLAARRRPPPRAGGVPAWLERALARGLATQPSARWPSVTALVDVLERTPRRRRNLALAGAGTLALGATLVIVAVMSRPAAGEPCGEVARPVDEVWSPARAAPLRTALLAADPSQGAARWQALAGPLDRQADGWRAMALDVCRANRVTHRESDTLHDRRVACLDRRLAELRAIVTGLATSVSPTRIDRAVVGVSRLSPLDACADTDALLALTPPPDDLPGRAAAAAITAEADAILEALAVGGDTGLAARAAALVARARATGHLPALALALRIDAEVAFDTAGTGGAVASLRELTEVAAAAHDDQLAAWAWPHLLGELDQTEGKHAEAATLLPFARNAVTRAGDDVGSRIKLLSAAASVLHAVGKPAEGQAALDEARALVLAAGAPEADPRIAALLGDLEYQAGAIEATGGRNDRAEPLFRRAIELTTAAFGGDHPDTAFAWQGLGEALRWQGKLEEALAAYQTAVRIRETRTGESTALASTLISLAAAQQALGRHDDALSSLRRAVDIFRAAGPASRRDLAVATMTEGLALVGLGRAALARARYDESIAVFEALGGHDSNHGITVFNRGELAQKSGDCAGALVDFRRALALFTEGLGPDHPYLVYPLAAMGGCLVELGQPDLALAALERALAIPVGVGEAALVAKARRDRDRARSALRRRCSSPRTCR